VHPGLNHQPFAVVLRPLPGKASKTQLDALEKPVFRTE
jgi:hypothetical protein